MWTGFSFATITALLYDTRTKKQNHRCRVDVQMRIKKSWISGVSSADKHKQ